MSKQILSVVFLCFVGFDILVEGTVQIQMENYYLREN